MTYDFYVTLKYATLRYITLCYATLRYFTLRYVMSRYVRLSCFINVQSVEDIFSCVQFIILSS